MNQERNKIAGVGVRVRFSTGLAYPEAEQIEHTGTIVLPLFPFFGWCARSDQTGETWALKFIELDWEVIE